MTASDSLGRVIAATEWFTRRRKRLKTLTDGWHVELGASIGATNSLAQPGASPGVSLSIQSGKGLGEENNWEKY